MRRPATLGPAYCCPHRMELARPSERPVTTTSLYFVGIECILKKQTTEIEDIVEIHLCKLRMILRPCATIVTYYCVRRFGFNPNGFMVTERFCFYPTVSFAPDGFDFSRRFRFFPTVSFLSDVWLLPRVFHCDRHHHPPTPPPSRVH